MKNNVSDDANAVLKGFLKQNNALDEKAMLKPLMGGRSGAGLFTFELNDQSYVLRLFAAMEELPSRKKESTLTAQVATFGFAPEVFYVDPNYLGMVIEYIPGHTFLPTESRKPQNIKKFATFLSRLHQVTIEHLLADGYFTRAWDWLAKAQKNKDHFPTAMDRLLKAVETIQHTVKHYPLPEVLIHGDLISRNILFDGEHFKLVDWPGAGYGNPYWDFIDYVDFQSFNDEEIRLFLSTYYQRDITESEWDLFVILRPIPSIVRLIGGFAFMPDVKSKAFYDEKRQEQNLVTFQQLINDFALDRMNVESWEIAMVFLIEAEKQLESEAFKTSLARLQSNTK